MEFIYNNYNYYVNNILSYLRVFKQKSLQYLYIQFLLYQKQQNNILKLTNYTTTRMNNNQSIAKRVSNHFSNMILQPTFIIDNIYLGNAYNASNANTIMQYDIKNIINVTIEIPNYFESKGIKYFNIGILDTDDHNFTFEQFNDVYRFICEADGHIMIHCYMGSSRSATIVVLYLMKKYGYQIDDAIEFIKNRREIVNINKNFINNLIMYNTSNRVCL